VLVTRQLRQLQLDEKADSQEGIIFQ